MAKKQHANDPEVDVANDYAEVLSGLTSLIQERRKAAPTVNLELLQMYCSIGCVIVVQQAAADWGDAELTPQSTLAPPRFSADVSSRLNYGCSREVNQTACVNAQLSVTVQIGSLSCRNSEQFLRASARSHELARQLHTARQIAEVGFLELTLSWSQKYARFRKLIGLRTVPVWSTHFCSMAPNSRYRAN